MPEARDTGERRSVGDTARLVIGVLLLAVVVAIVADNRRDTRIGYVVGDVEAPLIIVLLIAALAGAAIGWLLLHRPRHRD
jgi:uncharacterized integral membrane protein